MVFCWSLSDSRSPQVSITLHSILADFINAVFWIVSTIPLISKSSSLCTHHLVTVPSARITIGISVIFILHSSFNSLATSRYLSFLLSFSGQQERLFPPFGRFSFMLSLTRSCLLAEIRWSICISKFQRILWVSFSWTDFGWSIYHLFV